MSSKATVGSPFRKRFQLFPRSSENQSANSVPANSRSRLTGSSRNDLTGPPAGRLPASGAQVRPKSVVT